jgi:signal transduction histidine kinase
MELSYVHEDEREYVRATMENAMKGRTSFIFQCRIIWKDGSIHWMEAGGKVQLNKDGSATKFMVGTNLDITNKVKVKEELESSLRARDEFLSIASHELKTPLTSLKLQAQIHLRSIKRNDPEAHAPEKFDDFLSQAVKQVSRLNRLVDDMLDVSRIRTGKLKIEYEHFNFCELTKEVVGRLESQFIKSGYQVPPAPVCEESNGNWDRLRIEQVITNLLTNAIRYGNKKPIKILVESTSNKIRLIVEDQGIGIKDSFKEVIFDRFERAVDSNESSGLGLGLFITKQIVLSHGGEIWVESEIGKGSKFIVELPRERN